MEGKPVPGQLVASRSGRDKGRTYLVVEVGEDNGVLVADGLIRRMENPKRKNLKHLNFYLQSAEELAEKLKSGQRITNPEIRKAIQRLMEQPEE